MILRLKKGPTLVMFTNNTFLEFTRSPDQHTIGRGKPLWFEDNFEILKHETGLENVF